MKIERMSQDKIRIFLTVDDLTERGMHKEDIWQEIPKTQKLFCEMMDQATSQLGFDPKGPLVVEVFAIPTQGMLVVVSRRLPPLTLDYASKENGEEEEEEEYDLAVTLEETDMISYVFTDFEHVVAVSKRIGAQYTDGGTLYRFKGEWVLQIEYDTSDQRKLGGLIANLAEFGEACSVTANILEAYGLVVMEDNAIEIIRSTF